MIPVQQTDTTKERGDCHRASVASLFNMEIDQVPNFRLFSDDLWWDVFCGFIWSIGYQVVDTVVDDLELKPTIDNCLLASIPSNYGNGYSHQVVINTKGVVVHDPLPGNPNNGRDVSDDLVYWSLIKKRPLCMHKT